MRILSIGLAVLAGAVALVLGLVLAVLAAGAGATAFIAAQVESRHPPAGRFVPVQGGRLAVLEAGPEADARGTVVLLHGASANAGDPMQGIGHVLAARGFRVIAFDRPGFGWSDRLARAAGSPAFQAAAIAQALAAMGVGRTVVFGHSWGGALALRLALDHPDHVSGLVLAAPVALPFPGRHLPLWARLALDPRIAAMLARTVAVPLGWHYLERAAQGAFAPQPMAEGYVERSRAALILRPGPALANIEDLVALPAALDEQAPRYGEIAVPTAIVAGEADPAVRVSVQAAPLARQIPGASLVRLPGIGHMVHYAAPQAVADAVDEVLSRAAAPDSR